MCCVNCLLFIDFSKFVLVLYIVSFSCVVIVCTVCIVGLFSCVDCEKKILAV